MIVIVEKFKDGYRIILAGVESRFLKRDVVKEVVVEGVNVDVQSDVLILDAKIVQIKNEVAYINVA